MPESEHKTLPFSVPFVSELFFHIAKMMTVLRYTLPLISGFQNISNFKSTVILIYVASHSSDNLFSGLLVFLFLTKVLRIDLIC